MINLEIIRRKLQEQDAALVRAILAQALPQADLAASCICPTSDSGAAAALIDLASAIPGGLAAAGLASRANAVAGDCGAARPEEGCENVVRILSHRIASGLEVARAKAAAPSPALGAALAIFHPEGIRQAITDRAVEAQVIERAANLARQLCAGARIAADTSEQLAASVGSLFAATVIPLTKDVQVAQLLKLAEEQYRARLEEALVAVSGLCLRHGVTLGTAESCTGGMVGAALTTLPGSSAYFKGGIVAYANEVKTSALGVDAELIATHGAVSAAVAEAMAAGARECLGVDLAVAVTGIAGPAGGTAQKPVGTVVLHVSGARHNRRQICHWPVGREAVRKLAVEAALKMILDILGNW